MDSEKFAHHWRHFCSLHLREFAKHLPGVSKSYQHDLRMTVHPWSLTLCMESLTPVLSLLHDPEAGALKTTFGFVRLCQWWARGRMQSGEEIGNCFFLQTDNVCLRPVDFLSVSRGLAMLVGATPAGMGSSCSSGWVQFAVSSALADKFHHFPSQRPASADHFPLLRGSGFHGFSSKFPKF